MVNNDNDRISPTLSAEDFDAKLVKMSMQLKVAKDRKKQAVSRLLKERGESDSSAITKETELIHSEEYDSSDLADETQDRIHKTPVPKKQHLSFQDILDYTEQREDDEIHGLDLIDTYPEDDDDYDNLTVVSSLTDDSYEKALSRAQELWEQAGMIGEVRGLVEYSNHRRQVKKEEAIETPSDCSINSVEMLFRHVFCDARDTLSWDDWKAWD
ncbi:MAG: hypothetical protein SGILL_002219 [Bacillariaceae sp.]